MRASTVMDCIRGRSLGARLAGLMLVLAAASLRAQTTLVADAHVNAARPAVNSGAISNINIGGGYTGLLQFDLSLLPAGTTAAQVSRAVLRVYVNRVDTAGLVSMQPLTSAWAEYGVTYATLPTMSAAAQVFSVSQAGAFVAVDVTALVQRWVTAPATNFGVALTAATAVAEFDSKENDLTAHPATLEVTLVSQGPAGATGATGPAGPVGAAGATGAIGPVGPQGISGPAGAAGAAGPTGPVGPQGPAGAAGIQGPVGPAGAVGPIGPAGPAGQKGDQGAQGIPGQAGAQGLTGATGAQGLSGPTGPQGVAGPVGLSFTGAYRSTANYGLADGVSYNGSGYVSLIAGNHGNTPDQSPAAWALFATAGAPGVAGAVGATGPAGAQGLTGATGATGAAGPQGPQGVQGPAVVNYTGNYASTTNYGAADAVSFGGSTYVSLAAANHGNTPGLSPAYWAVLAAQGASGATGPQGPAGPQGVAGVAGATGATGPQGPPVAFAGGWLAGTAYGVGSAVSYGGGSYIATVANIGREPDISPAYWGVLAAAGAAGPAGATGATGLQGPTGYPGPSGATGATGPAGPTGATGPAGAIGPAGPAGVAGPTGAAGPAGLTYRGTYASTTNYAVGDAVIFQGSSYISTVASNAGNTPGFSPAAWSLLAAQGATGATGTAGANGNDGSTGATGPAGAAATVQVGTVTTGAAGSSASVVNSGTASAAVLNFTIPQGAAGAGGTGSSVGASTSGVPFQTMYHAVSYAANFYSVNNTNQSATESAAVLTYVPAGCSATKLVAFSQQAATITVTLRTGTPGAMADSALSCSVASGSSCTATGNVAIPPGAFLDIGITHPDGTPSGVWTAVSCN